MSDAQWLESLFHPPAAITLVSGESGSGKTQLCARAVAAAEAAGWTVRGITCPGRYDSAGRRIAIDLLDLANGARYALAQRVERDARTGRAWQFAPEALARGAAALEASGSCDLLLVDEIGPLELHENQGWANAVAVLRAGRYRRALVVVRPGLLDTLSARLDPLPLHVLNLSP